MPSFAPRASSVNTLRLQLEVIAAPLPPSAFARATGVVGVHGGAFANLHACSPGAVVIEIISADDPRWYAAPRRCRAPRSLDDGLPLASFYPLAPCGARLLACVASATTRRIPLPPVTRPLLLPLQWP